MRYAVLADIHGNLQALDAVLAETRRQGVDGYLVAGDLVGYGADPNACVERVAALDAVCVAGNHDLIALGRLSADRCIPLAQASLRWTAAVLSEQSRRFLAALPPRAIAPDGIVVAHGSLTDPQEYVHSRRQALTQLRQLHEDHADARVLVLGHTHIPLASAASRRLRPVGSLDLRDTGTVLLNPGAVGQSRELRLRARFLLLDTERRRARFMAIPYDVDGCRDALERAGLSLRSCHLRPSPMRAAVRRVRRLIQQR
jgi:predicted phosphodiesterase